jgi:hypothetical protein
MVQAFADAEKYRSVSVDDNGRLHILFDNGQEVALPVEKGQTSFSDPAVSPDGRTVGWIVMMREESDVSSSDEFAAELVLYQQGHIVRRFTSYQTFWGWQFRNGGQQVAYATGPTHGGASECLLRDIGSGRVVARWMVTESSPPPAWAKDLHF